MGCSKKKFRTERSPRSIIPLFSCIPTRMPFSSAVLLRSCPSRSFGTLCRLLLGCKRVGIRRAYTHDARKPARLREGLEHQDQKDRKRCRQKRARPAKKPRPEDKPDEENCRRDAKPPSHKHRRECVLGQYVDHYDSCDYQQCPLDTVLGQGQNHSWCHSQRQSDPGYEAQEEGQDAPHQWKVNPKDEQQDGHASTRDEVDYGPQSELADHVPAEDGQAHHLWAIPACAGAQAVHQSRSLCQ